MNTPKKNKIKQIFGWMLFLIIGFIFGWIFHRVTPVTIPTSIREDSSNYKLIHPLLFLQVPEDESTPEFQLLKNTVSKYITNAIHQNNASDVSVYFRELETSRWIGVNTDDVYAPASMLKVASLIAFFRASQDAPELLTKEVTIHSKDNGNITQDYYPPVHQAKDGHTYSVEDLLAYMVVDSDNNALEAINEVTGDQMLNKTYTDLRLTIPTDKDLAVQDFFTVKMVSRLFRTLYNGTYISKASSEEALDLLTQTTFTDGLVAGVPKGITVAHKFGEHTLNIINSDLSSRTIRELHDCGIVYLPNNPYFVCVMTKGSDFVSLQKIIVDISNIVWNEAQKFKK